MIAVVLAGGRGVRLWPESRNNHPKQLCRFINSKSMLDDTLDRLAAAGADKFLIITNDMLLGDIENLVKYRDNADKIEIISEPEGKNTAPAVGLSLTHFYPGQQDEVLAIFPADHHVLDIPSFCLTLNQAVQAAEQNHIVTIGIEPDRAETGYGYIEKSNQELHDLKEVFPVLSFREKPDLKTAGMYLDTGRYLWNSGIYVGKVKTLMEEFANYLPEIFTYLQYGCEHYLQNYGSLPNISLDYGIAEKSKRITVVPGRFGWSDIGNWNALAELFPYDQQQNHPLGQDVLFVDSKTVVLFGVKDLMVVETDDVILVAERQRCQDISQLVKQIETLDRHDLL
jgi:mannose-1-phosphate guanylyltransferase/mannose-6-phosphate isomerase